MGPHSTTEQLFAYLPPDRGLALLQGESLPAKSEGSVLFSDISGFTPLTEAVIARFGPRRGGEEFTNRLNAVYDALIGEVELFGGSIVGFAGDAMVVWFAGSSGARAVTVALRMQRAMQRFNRVELPDGETISLGLKVAIASGMLRRFEVGDPGVQLYDALAGEVMVRVAACEGVSNRGEVVVDATTAQQLGADLLIGEWRKLTEDPAGGQAAVVTGMRQESTPQPLVAPTFPHDAADRLRPWLVPEVARRVIAGQMVFLTELRPATALFVRFMGIDFEHDESGPAKLNAYVRWVQAIIARLEGVLVQLSIGEKGNYFYAAWGAPVAHDDDTVRAATAGLEIARPPREIAELITVTQVGITRGTMRTGAYGNVRRRTYGVLGDDTNLSARLMAKAGPGEILISANAAERLPAGFELESLPLMKVKGKKDPIPVFRVAGRRQAGTTQPMVVVGGEAPLVGRKRERSSLIARLQQAGGGRGQVIAVSSEAGMGKSRLLAEVVQAARRLGFGVFAGECQVLSREAIYAVWIHIFRTFFAVPPEAGAREALAVVEAALDEVGPGLRERAPLLAPLLNLALPDNDLTRGLDPKVRRASLEGLIVECIRVRARSGPVLFVLEEVHWIDESSRSLLAAVARAMVRLPVVVLAAHRPAPLPEVMGLPEGVFDHVHTLHLGDLPPEESRELVEQKLAKALDTDVPPERLVELVTSRAGGNPFFIEEVANLLRVRHLAGATKGGAELDSLELPDSLHSLVLSRIDQLTESTQTTLKVASVIGRHFRSAVLLGVHPLEYARAGLPAQIEEMRERDVILPEPAEGEEAYLFRHIVLQEVAYESLPFAFRSDIHEAIGLHLERVAGDDPRPWIELLAFHFDRSPREDKKRRYLLAAGDAARAAYALPAAISYYERALPLFHGDKLADLLFRLGEVQELAGKWDAAFARYREARTLAEKAGVPELSARIAGLVGDLYRRKGEFREAKDWLDRAREENAALGNEAGVAHMLHLEGTLSAQTGDFAQATVLYGKALAIREQLGDELGAGRSLNNLGIVARSRGDTANALQFHRRSLAVRRKINDRREIANSLNNLGFAHLYLGEFEEARSLLEESLQMNRSVGDRWQVGNALTSLAELALKTDDAGLALRCLAESVAINRELGDRRALAYQLEGFGRLGRLRRLEAVALLSLAAARVLRTAIGAPLEPADAEKL
ncbi:MAG: hypothetical protein QG602_2404, partial [Verrucomicrobiota bacterium]|nr:hypothetical protein [Verrucomicrobiota bacterium]